MGPWSNPQARRGTDELAGLDLSGAWFCKANFRGAKFAGARLRGASFWKADLREADLTGAVLTDVGLQHADITDAKFCDANLTGSNLRYARGVRADFEGARLGATFTNANLSAANFRRARLTRSTKFEGTVFAGANFRDVDLSRVPRLGVLFHEADLTGAVLQRPRTRRTPVNREDPVWAVEWSHGGLMGVVSSCTLTLVHAVVAPNAVAAAKAMCDFAVEAGYLWVRTARVELAKRQRMRLVTRNLMRNEIYGHVWSAAAGVVEFTGGRAWDENARGVSPKP